MGIGGAISVGELIRYQLYWNMINNSWQALRARRRPPSLARSLARPCAPPSLAPQHAIASRGRADTTPVRGI